MTERKGKADVIDIKGLLAGDGDFVRAAVEALVQAALEAEMTEAIGAAKGERSETRLSYRSGYYTRSLITRVGTLELRVPQDRMGRFSTELFERCQRSEKALVGALAEMYVQGVSTRKVKAVTEALCGHSFSASSISAINKSLDESLRAFAERRLGESFPYLILDARYERIREAGIITSQAVLVAVGVDEDGRGPSAHGLDPWGQILAVELANRESRSSWRDFLLELKERGLAGVEYVVSDDHPGLKRAIREVLPEAAWQRCYVHFLRNALDYVPRKSLPRRRPGSMTTACRNCVGFTIAAISPRCGATSPPGSPNGRPSIPGCATGSRRTSEETLTYYRLPLPHHKHMKSTNMLERLNQELKRRTHVVRIFPNAESCLRLVRALAVEMHENWLEATRYLNMDHLKEHKKEALRALAA